MPSCLNHCYSLASNSYLLFSWKLWPLTRLSCLIHPTFMATYLPQLHLKGESDSHSVVSDSGTLCTVACQAPVHAILQVRILEWVAIPFSRGSSWSRVKPVSLTSLNWQVGPLPLVPPGKPWIIGHLIKRQSDLLSPGWGLRFCISTRFHMMVIVKGLHWVARI